MTTLNAQRRSVILVVCFIAALAFTGYWTVGFPGLLFGMPFVGGAILWFLTTYQTPVDPSRILFPYLLTVAAFIVHVYEEYVAHIEHELSHLAGANVSQFDFLTIAGFAAPVIWVLGAALMIKRWQLGYFLVSTFLFGMMFGEVTHFINPFLTGGTFRYSAGMATAVLPIIGGWYTFILLRREMRKEKELRA